MGPLALSSSAHSPGPVGPAAPSQGRHPQSFTCVYRISRAPAQRPGPSHPGCPGVTIRFPPGGGEHHQDPRRAPILSPPPSAAPSEHRPCRCGGAPSEAAYVPPSQWGGPAGRLVWFQVAPERWARCWAEGKRMAAPAPDPQFILRGAGSAVRALHFCSGAQGRPLLLSGSLRGLVHIWNLETRRPLAALDGHGGQCVTWLHTLPRGPQLLSQGRDLQLCVWDLAEGRGAVVDAVRLESVGFCRASVLAEGPQRWTLAVPGRGSDEVQILELPSKTLVSCLKPEAGARLGMPMCLQLWQVRGTHELTNPGIADLKIRPDSKILATAGWDHRVRVFQWRTMRPLAVLAFHSATVHCVAFDATGLLAAGSGDQRISVWSLYPPT
ncbi:guanine nucleotide-binding protein subunit beta-like protein 1 isoform X3 [Ovis aries]|uniref:guanine nucleotide-binding protein subunit beta-like protein 1 isoform X3 n=1 Tax=Ovis aries TaxID=9940 RepID=UPI001C2ED0C3|nr:guanine nucleotide-binding protein subunit beta-like protein 1 isoform X3 [Ovis aries]